MSLVQRRLFGSAKLLCSYAKLLNRPHFKPLKETLSKVDTVDVSAARQIVNLLEKLDVSARDQAAVHNDILATLVKDNYGISNVHLKALQDLSVQPSKEALLELIRSNPGRVDSSWDLFVKYRGTEVSDDIVHAVIQKIIQMDQAMIADGKHNLDVNDIAQIVILLESLSDKTALDPQLYESFLNDIFREELSCLLPLALSLAEVDSKVLKEKLVDATDIQFIHLLEKIDPQSIVNDEELLLLSLDRLKPSTSATETEIETKNKGLLLEAIEYARTVSKLPFEHTLFDEPLEDKKAKLFSQITGEVQNNKLDETNIQLALKLLRIVGLEIGDVKLALEMYHNYLIKYVSHSEELMFEAFLMLSYQAVKTNNKQLQQYSEAFIPANLDIRDSLYTKFLCGLILSKSKFSMDDALELYNDKNQVISKTADEHTLKSPFDRVTECLIMGYMLNRDIDFARVIFQEAMGQKLFSGTTITKSIKRHMAEYGEATEKGTIQESMEKRILDYLCSI